MADAPDFQGIARIRTEDSCGMIALRADPEAAGALAVIGSRLGLDMPGPLAAGDRRLAGYLVHRGRAWACVSPASLAVLPALKLSLNRPSNLSLCRPPPQSALATRKGSAHRALRRRRWARSRRTVGAARAISPPGSWA